MQKCKHSEDITSAFTITDVLVVIGLSFGLSAIIAWVYKTTYKGLAYSQNYVHTLIMMSMIVAIIMLVIGSNIARAFSLVGVVSIIRFRNAMKDTRDVGFVFFAIAIGMACGTGFYTLAIVSTIIVSALMFQMSNMNLFARDSRAQILKIRVSAYLDYESAFTTLFNRYLEAYKLVSIKVGANESVRLEYLIKFRKDVQTKTFITELRQINGSHPITIVTDKDGFRL